MVLRKYRYFSLITIIFTFYSNIFGMEMGENDDIDHINNAMHFERSNNKHNESADLDEIIAMKKQLKAKEKRHSTEVTKNEKPKMSERRRRTVQGIENVISEWSSAQEKKKKSEREKVLETEISEYRKATQVLNSIAQSLSENSLNKNNFKEDTGNNEEEDNLTAELEFIAKLTEGLPEEVKQKILNNYHNNSSDQANDMEGSTQSSSSTTQLTVEPNSTQVEKPFSVKKAIYKVFGIGGFILGVVTSDANVIATSTFLLSDAYD